MERRTFDVEMWCCRQEDTDELSVAVAEPSFLLLGRCKFRKDVRVVSVSTSVSDGNELGSCDAGIWYTGQLLRWTEVVSCMSLLCVVNVSTANVTLTTTRCRGAEDDSMILDRARWPCVSLKCSGVEMGYAVDGSSVYVGPVSGCLLDG